MKAKIKNVEVEGTVTEMRELLGIAVEHTVKFVQNTTPKATKQHHTRTVMYDKHWTHKDLNVLWINDSLFLHDWLKKSNCIQFQFFFVL